MSATWPARAVAIAFLAAAPVAAAERAPAPAPLNLRVDAAAPATPAPALGGAATQVTAPSAPAAAAIPSAADAVPLARTSLPPSLAVLRLLGAAVIVAVLLGAGVVAYRRFALGAPRRGARRGGWLGRWTPAATREADRIDVLSRSYFGARESLGVIRVGDERFLIGVTAASITMLSRLAPTAPPAGRGCERVEQPELSERRSRIERRQRAGRVDAAPHADVLAEASRVERTEPADAREYAETGETHERAARFDFARELEDAEAAPSEEAIRSAFARTRARLERIELAAARGRDA